MAEKIIEKEIEDNVIVSIDKVIESKEFKVIYKSTEDKAGEKNFSIVTKVADVIDVADKTKLVERKLVFNKVDLVNLEDGIHPSFICPECKRNWIPKLDMGDTFTEPFDFNDQITLIVPEHFKPDTKDLCPQSNGVISLFFAIHKDKGKVSMCIQRTDAEGASGIDKEWYNRNVVEESV